MNTLKFVTDKERAENLNNCMCKLKEVTTAKQLTILLSYVRDELRRTDYFFFPKGGKKEFEDASEPLIEKYAKVEEKEVENLFRKCETAGDFKRLKSNIYACILIPYEPVKKELFEKCDKEIARIEAQAS